MEGGLEGVGCFVLFDTGVNGQGGVSGAPASGLSGVGFVRMLELWGHAVGGFY